MDKKRNSQDSIKYGLNITDQEISEALSIDIEQFKEDKNKGELTTYLGTIMTGWWSNNWCE